MCHVDLALPIYIYLGILIYMSIHEEPETVLRNRKRPSKTSTSARTARVPFGDQARKELPIPKFIDQYNHNMNDVDQGDQLQASYPGLRRCRRGGWQSLFVFLLNTVLVNSYLLSLLLISGI